MFYLLGLSLLWQSETVPEETISIDRWDRAICLISPGSQAEKGKLATGFVVAHQEDLFLVTAWHAAEETSTKTRLHYRDTRGKSQYAGLSLLFQEGEFPWKRHRNSDLATAKLVSSGQSVAYTKQLRELAIELTDIARRPPRRGARIEVAGFPLGLGVQPETYPLVIYGNIASRVIPTSTDWGKEPLQYCSPAMAQGTSGGPAFLSQDDATAVTLLGMYVAVAADSSGGKLSKLVPSSEIRKAVEGHETSQGK